MRIDHEITLEKAKRMAVGNERLRYGANTCWWAMDEAPWYSTNRDNPDLGLPCDPRHGMLFETDKALDFIAAAENHIRDTGAENVYGKHGIRTFLLAYHGCVVTDEGLPTCFQTWKEYSDLIDEKGELDGTTGN